MESNYFLCIIEEMDRLWFHQIILFSEPTSNFKAGHKPVEEEKPFPTSEFLVPCCQSSMFSLLPLPDDETSTDESPSPEKQVSLESLSSPLQDGSINNKEERKERLARMNLLGNRIRSHSSSPSSQHSHRSKFRKPATITRRKLHKSMSCRTLGELELDEVKGFMDLGFIFKKETLSPRMMSVVPGLQRLGLHKNKHNNNTQLKDVKEAELGDKRDTESDEEVNRHIMRPYLSEAWLIKRPDSKLLSLKVPKACSASNMKKHLRFWAKTVASEIHQE